MRVRGFKLEDRSNWIDLLKRVQEVSDSWEAAYLDKPRFSDILDFVLEIEGGIVGVLAGHAIYQDSGTFFSVEVLAIDPKFQGLGYGAFFVSEVSRRLPLNSPLLFWTRSATASTWYEKLGFYLHDQVVLQQKQVQIQKTPQKIGDEEALPRQETGHKEILDDCFGEIFEKWSLERQSQHGVLLKAYAIKCPWWPPNAHAKPTTVADA